MNFPEYHFLQREEATKRVGIGPRIDELGGNVVANVVVNVVATTPEKLSESESKARQFILGDPHLTAVRLGEKLGVTSRQAQRILAALRKKAGLKRRGADKNGEWYFAPPKAP